MPHLIIEYARDLDPPITKTLQALHQTLSASELFDEADIKIRAQPYTEYLVGGHKANRFVHLTVLLLDGRSDAVKSHLGKALRETVKQNLGNIGNAQITVEVRDMARATYIK